MPEELTHQISTIEPHLSCHLPSDNRVHSPESRWAQIRKQCMTIAIYDIRLGEDACASIPERNISACG